MMETKQQDMGKALRDAVLQQAVDAGYASSSDGGKNDGKTPIAVGSGAPGPGRPRNVKNRLTNLREAVLEAFDRVGGAQYLVKLAEGTQSDRAAFVGLVAKVLPTQINANVEGGIQVQLSWLGSRQIGTTQTQPAEVVTQVIDLERDPKGKYRIADQDAGGTAQADDAQKGVGGAQDT